MRTSRRKGPQSTHQIVRRNGRRRDETFVGCSGYSRKCFERRSTWRRAGRRSRARASQSPSYPKSQGVAVFRGMPDGCGTTAIAHGRSRSLPFQAPRLAFRRLVRNFRTTVPWCACTTFRPAPRKQGVDPPAAPARQTNAFPVAGQAGSLPYGSLGGIGRYLPSAPTLAAPSWVPRRRNRAALVW